MIMTEFVKRFIEDTKYVIDRNLWSVFFYKWYRESAKIWPSTVEEAELFAILKLAKLPVDWNARKQIIVEATKVNISEVLNDLEAWKPDNIPVSYLADELITHLGLDHTTIEQCIDTATVSLNLRLNQNKTGYSIPGR